MQRGQDQLMLIEFGTILCTHLPFYFFYSIQTSHGTLIHPFPFPYASYFDFPIPSTSRKFGHPSCCLQSLGLDPFLMHWVALQRSLLHMETCFLPQCSFV